MSKEKILVDVEDIKECLGETTRLINEIRLDPNLKFKIPKTVDFLEITSKLFLALKYASLFSNAIEENEASKKLEDITFIYLDKESRDGN